MFYPYLSFLFYGNHSIERNENVTLKRNIFAFFLFFITAVSRRYIFIMLYVKVCPYENIYDFKYSRCKLIHVLAFLSFLSLEIHLKLIF